MNSFGKDLKTLWRFYVKSFANFQSHMKLCSSLPTKLSVFIPVKESMNMMRCMSFVVESLQNIPPVLHDTKQLTHSALHTDMPKKRTKC